MPRGRVVGSILGLAACLAFGSCDAHSSQSAASSAATDSVRPDATSADLVRCTSANLTSHLAANQVGAGMAGAWIAVTNTGAAWCGLGRMRPTGFVAIRSGGSGRRFRPSRAGLSGFHRLTVLPPGRSAWFELGWGADPGMCGHPQAPNYPAIRFTLGRGTGFTVRLAPMDLNLGCRRSTGVTPLVRPPFPAATSAPR